MNFEKFYSIVMSNWKFLPNKRQTLLCLCYHYDLLLWKKKKLKLGAIVFIIKEYKFDEVLLWEEPQIKFINQDTTVEDERKLEVIFANLGWHWNYKNYIALGTVIAIGFNKINIFLKTLYYRKFPSLAFRDEHYDFLLKSGFEEVYMYHSIGFLAQVSRCNFWLIDVLTNFSIYYSIIF